MSGFTALTIKDFGRILVDECAAEVPVRARTVAVIYYTPKPVGHPDFKVEAYQTACR
jgi:hypothetical protein